jgi:hypothetical protein
LKIRYLLLAVSPSLHRSLSFLNDLLYPSLTIITMDLTGQGKVAGKRNANFLRLGSCASLQLSLASKSESRPAALVMVVTDF